MRGEGRSLRAIADELDVALSSASMWTRNVVNQAPQTPEGATRLADGAQWLEVDPALRSCGKCRRILPTSSFGRSRRDGRQAWCRGCFKAYFAERGELHREQSGRAQAAPRSAANRFLATYLAGAKCADCGVADPAVLEFDHLRDKRRSISTMRMWGCSTEDLVNEISKCEVVCANCHRQRTCARSGSWRCDPDGLDSVEGLAKGQRRNLKTLRDHLRKNGCVDCGISDLPVLDFDHRGEKTIEVAVAASSGLSTARLMAEIEKCDVRCACCHRRRHQEERIAAGHEPWWQCDDRELGDRPA